MCQHNQLSIFSILVALLVIATTAFAADPLATKEAWDAAVGKNATDNPAFAFVEDDPDLPSVLIIGDSISIGYTAPVREKLSGFANVHRIPVNAANTEVGMKNIEVWLRDRKWDVIHFNWGLHDIKRVDENKKMDATKDRAISPEAYTDNLRALVTRLKKTNAHLIWAATTPVPEGAAGRIPGGEIEYNALAASIMKDEGIAVNDLHAQILPRLEELQRKANVHFYDPGSAFLAEQVVKEIKVALNESSKTKD